MSVYPSGATVQHDARFSPCRRYRYWLSRIWAPDEPKVAFVGLNPSTADENVDDPTIRRCVGFAGRWGYGGVYMLNLFAIRTPYPRLMRRASDPIGPNNDEWIRVILRDQVSRCIVAWGNSGTHLDRAEQFAGLTDAPLYCLATNKGGQPKHPLYVKGDVEPVEWKP